GASCALERQRRLYDPASLESAALGRDRAVLSLAPLCGADRSVRNAAALEPLSVLRNTLCRQQPVGGLLSRQPALLSSARYRSCVWILRAAASDPLRMVHLPASAAVALFRRRISAGRPGVCLLRLAGRLASTPHLPRHLLLDPAPAPTDTQDHNR